MSTDRELLRRALILLEMADCSTGYCCCGSAVDKHGMGDGHSPVDEGDYAATQCVADIRAHLAEGGRDG